MKRKLLVGIVIVVVIAGGLAAVKTTQIKTMIAFGASFTPPPETVATAIAHEEEWQDALPAVGSVTPAQGVMIAPEISGTVSEIAFEVGFQSLTHFNRVFKKILGQSPTEYRAQLLVH